MCRIPVKADECSDVSSFDKGASMVGAIEMITDLVMSLVRMNTWLDHQVP